MTIREYAKSRNISYEAARKQIARYRETLSDHITTKNRVSILDDFAVEFLDQRRRESPISVIHVEESEVIQALRDQLDALKSELMTTQKQVIDLQKENQKMLSSQVKYDLLAASNTEKQSIIDSLRDDVKNARQETEEARKEEKIARQAVDVIRDQRDEAKKEADDARRERDEAINEAKSYRKSIFGFYRKVR